jgi:transposase
MAPLSATRKQENAIMKNTTQSKQSDKSRREGRIFVGVDISKAELVCDLPGKPSTYRRDAKGMSALIRALPQHAHVVCEATGGYEKPLLNALHQAAVPVSCVMPRRVRQYASSQGQMAKNDRIDARILSMFGRNSEQLAERKPLVPSVAALRELTRQRDNLLELIKQQTNQDEQTSGLEFLRKLAAKRMAFYKKQLNALEKEIEKLVAGDEQLSAKAQRCGQIAGVGKVSVWSVLAEMPELGEFERGQAARMLGVAPICKDSGSSLHASRAIADGRPRPRRVIYMAAISASQHNATLKALYMRLRAKGKPPKVALVAVMRKLIELINNLLADPNFLLVR